MAVLFQIVFAAHCRGTHHKLAMDALRNIQGESAAQWRRMLLRYFSYYLRGAEARRGDGAE